MQSERRPAAELLSVGRLGGQEKRLVLNSWIERLKDLPVSPARRMEKRLTMLENGQLSFDLSNTPMVDFAPLEGMPVAELNLSACDAVADLRPLRRLPLRAGAGVEIDFQSETDIIALRGHLTRHEKPNYQVYQFAGASHIRNIDVAEFGLPDPEKANPADWVPFFRALFVAGNNWCNGIQPPPSLWLGAPPTTTRSLATRTGTPWSVMSVGNR